LNIPRPLDFVSRNVDKHLAVDTKNISEDLDFSLIIRLFKVKLDSYIITFRI